MASDAHTWPLLASPSVARPRESQPAGALASLSVHPELSSRSGVSHSQRHVRSSHLQPANEGWCWEFKRPQQMQLVLRPGAQCHWSEGASADSKSSISDVSVSVE